jgi:pimeloyl-ACP methyl ester carboxylesterase
MERLRRLALPTLCLLVLILLLPTVLDAFVRQMLYPAPLVAVGAPPAGLVEVELPIGGGERAIGWAGGAGAAPGRPVALFFHGNGENLETMRRAGLYEELARLDVPYLAVDYPGYGRSDGTASEESLLAAAEAALAWAESEHPGGPVVACGWSLGAAVAVQLAARHPDEVAGLALLAPWTELAELAAIHFPAPFVRTVLRGQYDSLAAAARIATPVLVVHGGRDTIIPVEHGERVARALGNARWVRVERAGHNDLLAFPEVWAELELFFASIGG